MTAPKFTHRDRMRVASEQQAALISTPAGDGMNETKLAMLAVVHADFLLAALAETPAPACVGEDRSLDLVAALLPYAETRAEDMQTNVNVNEAAPAQKDEEQALADKAWLAIDDAKDLLRKNGVVVP